MIALIRRNLAARVAAAVCLLLVGAFIINASRTESPHTVSAVFPRTVSLFEGSDVRIMGIRVGKVTAITPQGTSVRVDMQYDAKYDVPADAKAVIIAPSVISDRFVQLTPAYDGGAKMADGTLISEPNTAVPVELDKTFAATQQLMTALGPNGANKNGAVSDVLSVFADVLRGQGGNLNKAIGGLSNVTATLGDNSDNIAGTITHLSGLTDRLATYDSSVERLNQELASVATSLSADQDDISELLTSLATSLGTVEHFVKDNRAALAANVSSLSTVTTALDGERAALTQIVDIAPLAFTDLVNTYDPMTKAVRTRANFAELIRRADLVICNAIPAGGGATTKAACDLLATIAKALPTLGGINTDAVSLPSPASGTLTKASQLPELVGGLGGQTSVRGAVADLLSGVQK